jgi:hypothetical protein
MREKAMATGWTMMDRSGLRASCPFRSGLWIRLRRKSHFACIPPNGAVLPYGIFATLVKVPVIDVARDAQRDPNRSEVLVDVLTEDANLWMEEVYQSDLPAMIRPFYGYHDFTILCGGLPVQVSSRDARWTARFTLRDEAHEIQDLDYEGMSQKLVQVFSGGSRIDVPKIRAGAFGQELAAAIIRTDLMVEALVCETLPGATPKDIREQAEQKALRNCDLLRRLRRRDVRQHRLALGFDDPAHESLSTSHVTVESLLAGAREI